MRLNYILWLLTSNAFSEFNHLCLNVSVTNNFLRKETSERWNIDLPPFAVHSVYISSKRQQAHTKMQVGEEVTKVKDRGKWTGFGVEWLSVLGKGICSVDAPTRSRLVINMPHTRSGRTDWWYRSPVDLCYWFHLPIPMNHWAWGSMEAFVVPKRMAVRNYRDCSPSYRNSSLPAVFPTSRTSAIGNVKIISSLRTHTSACLLR